VVGVTSKADEPALDPWVVDKVALTGCHPGVASNSICAGLRRLGGVAVADGIVVVVVVVVVLAGGVGAGSCGAGALGGEKEAGVPFVSMSMYPPLSGVTTMPSAVAPVPPSEP
jgi:hypothetical protein